MHEVSIMQNTLDIAIAQERQNGANKIDCLTLKIGELSGVIPEALEFAFDVLIQGTIAENARLEIKNIPVVCYCPYCDRTFEPQSYIFECSQCHQLSSNILQGKELNLVSVDISE